MSKKLFETALGFNEPWHVADVELGASARTLTVRIDFAGGHRFALAGEKGFYPLHSTVSKRYSQLNYLRYKCYLEFCAPRVRLPKRTVCQVENHFNGIIASAQNHQTNSLLEALNGLFQFAKRSDATWRRQIQYNPYSNLPVHWQTRFLETQPTCGVLTHSKFKSP